jgi:hypothetical protein
MISYLERVDLNRTGYWHHSIETDSVRENGQVTGCANAYEGMESPVLRTFDSIPLLRMTYPLTILFSSLSSAVLYKNSFNVLSVNSHNFSLFFNVS